MNEAACYWYSYASFTGRSLLGIRSRESSSCAKAGGTVIFGCITYSFTDFSALKDVFETFEFD